MQTSRRTLVFLTTVTNNFVRNVTVSASVVDKNNDMQLKSWKEIPGPSSLPIIGQLHHFLPGGILSDLNKLQEVLYTTYGPICRLDAVFGRQTMIFLYDAEATAFVLRSENRMPIRPGLDSLDYYRKYHNKPKEQLLGPTGLITDHGDTWRYFRTTVNPVMLQPKTIKLYRSLIEEVAEDMIKRMKSIRNEKNMLNGSFDIEMNLWALESIGVVALGGRLNCLDPNLAEDSPVKRLIHCVHNLFRLANDLEFKVSLWRYLPTKGFKKTMEMYEEQENLTKYFVGKTRQKLLANKKEDSEKGILEKLLEIDEKVAVIMASDMLFAGVDTTAITMTATLYLLATNQDKQDKLRDEINSVDESKKYLKACIKESLRLFPVVAGNMRKTTQDYNILGYKVPKDITIGFPHQFVSKMESQFPRANEYIPERWIDKGELSHKSANPFAYSPFGFGVRMCIGRRIAELEIETFLAQVVKNFKVEWFGPPPAVEALSLNYIKGPFNFVFKDVK